MECVHLQDCTSLSLPDFAELAKRTKAKNALKCKGKKGFAGHEFITSSIAESRLSRTHLSDIATGCSAILEKRFLTTQLSDAVPVEQVCARIPIKRMDVTLEHDADFVDAAIGDDHCIGGVVVGHWKGRRRSRLLIRRDAASG